MTRTFPILFGTGRERAEHERLDAPRSVPWALVEPHEEQAQRNHGQSLARLAERGGLSPAELCAVVEGRDLDWVLALRPAEAVARIRALLAEVTPCCR